MKKHWIIRLCSTFLVILGAVFFVLDVKDLSFWCLGLAIYVEVVG